MPSDPVELRDQFDNEAPCRWEPTSEAERIGAEIALARGCTCGGRNGCGCFNMALRVLTDQITINQALQDYAERVHRSATEGWLMPLSRREIAVELDSAEIQALVDGLSMTGQIAEDLGRKKAWHSAMDKLGNAQRALSIEVPHHGERNTGVTPQWRRDAFAGDPTGGNR